MLLEEKNVQDVIADYVYEPRFYQFLLMAD